MPTHACTWPTEGESTQWDCNEKKPMTRHHKPSVNAKAATDGKTVAKAIAKGKRTSK